MFRSLVLLNRSWHEVGACCGESLGLGGEGIECLLGNVPGSRAGPERISGPAEYGDTRYCPAADEKRHSARTQPRNPGATDETSIACVTPAAIGFIDAGGGAGRRPWRLRR